MNLQRLRKMSPSRNNHNPANGNQEKNTSLNIPNLPLNPSLHN